MHGLFFDFDGVVADSEWISNTILAEGLTSLGLPTTFEQSLERYGGRRWPDVEMMIEESIGRKLDPGFVLSLEDIMHERFVTDLKEVEGLSAFLSRFSHLPRCVASSSGIPYLTHALKLLKHTDTFGEHVYSGTMMPRGKPHPDVYLFAAEKIGVKPESGIVIEDSPTGVQAGIAAGMTVIGLCAGKHCRPGHDAKLREAGVHHIAHRWADAGEIVARLV